MRRVVVAFLCAAAVSIAQKQPFTVDTMLKLARIGEPVLSTFVELVGQDDSNLDRLEALIKERREGNRR